MKKIIKQTALRILAFLWMLAARWQAFAQDDEGDEPLTQHDLDLIDEMDEEDIFSLSHYSDELLKLFFLTVLIFIIRAMVPRRHRTGCTYWIIFGAILIYMIMRACR